jgi:hypothetical protein
LNGIHRFDGFGTKLYKTNALDPPTRIGKRSTIDSCWLFSRASLMAQEILDARKLNGHPLHEIGEDGFVFDHRGPASLSIHLLGDFDGESQSDRLGNGD